MVKHNHSDESNFILLDLLIIIAVMYGFRYSGEVSGISQTFAMMAALVSPLVASALTPQVTLIFIVLPNRCCHFKISFLILTNFGVDTSKISNRHFVGNRVELSIEIVCDFFHFKMLNDQRTTPFCHKLTVRYQFLKQN